MRRRMPPFVLVCVFIFIGRLCAQSIAGVEIHGFATQGFLYSSNNNYLTMESSNGSAAWTDGAVTASDSLTEKLRAGIQLHMYQLGQLGGPRLQMDWASADYRINDHFGIRAGKVKTVLGLFNDSQDVDAIFLWTLLPQCSYPVDNKSFFLAHLGGEVYGGFSLGSRAGKLEYHGYAGYISLDLDGGFVKEASQSGLIFRNAPGGKTYGGDLRWHAPLKGLTVGSSADIEALDGTAPAGRLHVAPFLISAQYAQFTTGKFYFAGEYDRSPANPIVTLGPAIVSLPQDFRSYYAMGSYRILKKLQAGGYYSHFVNKSLDTSQPANYSKDRVISGRYDFNSYFYGKVEGHFLQGTALGYYAESNPTGLKPDSKMLAVKIGFSF